MKAQHFRKGELLDEFLVGCYQGKVAKYLFCRDGRIVMRIGNGACSGQHIACKDLEECGFPGAVPPKDGMGLLLAECKTDVPEDPFSIEFLAGIIQDNIHDCFWLQPVSTAEKTSYFRKLPFGNLGVPSHDPAGGVCNK